MTAKNKVWTLAEVRAWFAGRLPDAWFTGPPTVTADREEILVVGVLPVPELGDVAGEPAAGGTDEGAGEGVSDVHAVEVAARARIRRFREDTRAARMLIADEAEVLWGRKVSWGARCGDIEELFTTQSVPVMTRLRMRERAVLDTLIDAGVARSRSEALAWCVRLVGKHQSDWIEQLRDAITRVERVRSEGPDRDAGAGAGPPPEGGDEPSTQS